MNNKVQIPRPPISLGTISGQSDKVVQKEITYNSHQEFINKPNILHDILNTLHKKDYKSDTYKKPDGEKWQQTTIKLPKGGTATFDYPGEDEKALDNLIASIRFVNDQTYPQFDKYVGSPITSIKELVGEVGYSKRKSKSAGSSKVIESYQPNIISRYKNKIEDAGRITIDFKKVHIKLRLEETNRHGKLSRSIVSKPFDATGTLIQVIKTESGALIFPHPIILLHAFGQTVEKARELAKDEKIQSVLSRAFYMSKSPTPKERRQMQGVTIGMYFDTISRQATKVDTTDPRYCFEVNTFYAFHKTKNNNELRRVIKKNLDLVTKRDGGEWWFTNTKNKRGVKLNRFTPFILFDFTTHVVFRKKLKDVNKEK